MTKVAEIGNLGVRACHLLLDGCAQRGVQSASMRSRDPVNGQKGFERCHPLSPIFAFTWLRTGTISAVGLNST